MFCPECGIVKYKYLWLQGVYMRQQTEAKGYSKEATDEYGNPHTLHIDGESNYTVHKHSGKPGEDDICPYCNDNKEYGHGITYDGPAFPTR